ncbi:MAG: TrmH family RNA methyltransferase, partial [Planctomycetota bacterium]
LLASDQGPERTLVLDGIHDPANVGALVRSARCLQVDAVVCGPGCADPFYRRAVRVSVGHVFHLPIHHTTDLPAWLTAARARGLWCVAGHRGPLSQHLDELSSCPAPWALVVGNEDRGPQPSTLAACDGSVAIRMAAGVDSLNVATAGAILLNGLREREA